MNLKSTRTKASKRLDSSIDLLKMATALNRLPMSTSHGRGMRMLLTIAIRAWAKDLLLPPPAPQRKRATRKHPKPRN
jgi:ABC-type molybdate transport system ATPase subunit